MHTQESFSGTLEEMFVLLELIFPSTQREDPVDGVKSISCPDVSISFIGVEVWIVFSLSLNFNGKLYCRLMLWYSDGLIE